MAIQKILQIGDLRLKNKNEEIINYSDKSLDKLCKDLSDTLIENDIIGIAAPQIGVNKKVFVTEIRKTKARNPDFPDKLRIFINPEIIEFSKECSIIYEGCGCVPNIFGPVSRPKQIKIKYLDIDSKIYLLKCDGILARVIQHEFDHLNGIEFTERITDYSKIYSRENYVKYIKNSTEQIDNSKITIMVSELYN